MAVQISLYGELAHATKKCPHCTTAKPLSAFANARGNIDGLRINCRQHKGLKSPIPKPAKNKVESKKAPYKQKLRSDEELKSAQIAIYGIDLSIATKKCPLCDTPKKLSEFGKSRTHKDGLRYKCKHHMKIERSERKVERAQSIKKTTENKKRKREVSEPTEEIQGELEAKESSMKMRTPKPRKRSRRTKRTPAEIKEIQFKLYGSESTAAKHCIKCKCDQLLSEFGKAGFNRDGLKTSCKKHQRKAIALGVPPGKKKCLDCDEPKDTTEFRKDDRSLDGFNIRCDYHAPLEKTVLNNRTDDEIQLVQKQLYPDSMKQCSECGEHKKLKFFANHRRCRDGLEKRCKKCIMKTSSARRRDNENRSPQEVAAAQLVLYGPSLLKECTMCGVEHKLSKFSKARKIHDGVHAFCKSCVKTDNIERREANSVAYNALKNAPCGECEEIFPPAAMDFAHLPGTVKYRSKTGKIREPGQLGMLNVNSETFQRELKLTRLLCACCHAIDGYKPPSKVKPGTKLINNAKLGRRKCTDCHRRVISGLEIMFDFDHIPGSTKIDKVSNLVNFRPAIIMAEIAKCELRCRNCHRIVTHYTRKGIPVPTVTQLAPEL